MLLLISEDFFERDDFIESLNVNGNVYHIESITFEDKSDQDENGYYEYYYKGIYISFHLDNEIITAKIYDGEEVIFFLKNPVLAFGQDFEGLKVYLSEKFSVKRFKFPGGEKGYTEL